MHFMEHLDELRVRLIRSGYAVLGAFVVAFFFKEHLYDLLKKPLQPYLPAGAKLIYTAPAELFFTYMKVSLLAGIIVASPVIFYQLWKFVSPGLYEKERKLVWPFVFTSSGLFIAGAIFCYLVVFPSMFDFFMGLSTAEIVPMLKVNEYLSFSSTMLLVFGLVFETPLILYFLAKLGVVNSAKLRKYRRYAILGIFVVAAVVSPTPDAITQTLMALPMMVLYEFSVLLIARVEKNKAKREAEETASEEPAS
ncbi:MAG: twin-arginine translocase subunit TatC [Desulfarculus sp.]|nr:twin-arginine translocase subunit TatC [Desulfarculus sp.]